MGLLLALDGRPLVEDDVHVEPIGFHLELLEQMWFGRLEHDWEFGKMGLSWLPVC